MRSLCSQEKIFHRSYTKIGTKLNQSIVVKRIKNQETQLILLNNNINSINAY